MTWLLDMRLWAIPLAFLGAYLGSKVPTVGLAALTVATLVAGFFLSGRNYLAEGKYGAFMLSFSGCVFFLMPMWLVWFILRP